MSDLSLIETIVLNGVRYAAPNIILNTASPAISIDAEILKYKRLNQFQIDSLIRKAKLLHNIRSSGEEEKLVELISKWESASKSIIKELYTYHSTGISFKKFVRNLGLNYEDLEFSDADEDQDLESDCQDDNFISKENYQGYDNNFNQFENNYLGSCDSKRFKYDDDC